MSQTTTSRSSTSDYSNKHSGIISNDEIGIDNQEYIVDFSIAKNKKIISSLQKYLTNNQVKQNSHDINISNYETKIGFSLHLIRREKY